MIIKMYITLNNLKGEKRIDLSYSIQNFDSDKEITVTQALHGLAPKCKLINMHELINKSTNHYVTLLLCNNGANVNNKG